MNNEHCICVRKENNTHGLGWRRRPAVLLLACAAGAFALVPPAGAVSGATPWAVLRCQLSDQPLPPVPESFYQDFFTAAGAAKGGLYDYWGQVSMGRVTLAGTQIFQWVPLYITSVQDPQRPRQKQVQDCINAAEAAHIDLSPFFGLFMIQNSPGGEFGGQMTVQIKGQNRVMGVAFFEFTALSLSTAAHEMGHGYGLDHAWDTAMNHWCGSSNPNGYGEYCDLWDAMGNPFMYGNTFANPNFGSEGTSSPGLNAQHLDFLGWIPQRFIYDVSQTAPKTVTLAALSHPGAQGYFEVGIAAWDPTNLYSPRGYTLEFRRATGWDRNIGDSVIIHAGWSPNGAALTYIVDNNGGPLWHAGQTFNDVSNNVTITINAINPATNTATVTISRLFQSGTGGGGGGGGGGGVPPYPYGHCMTCQQ